MVKFDPRAAALAALFALAAGAARAGDADEVVATRSDPAQAPSTAATAPVPAPAPPPMTTEQQIRAWLSQPAPVSRMSRDDADPWTDTPTVAEDGRPHGEVGAMIGTGGSRAAWGTVTMPLGQHGTATFSYAQGHKLPYYGYGPYYDPRFAPFAPW